MREQVAVTDPTWTSNAEQWTLRTLLERRLTLDADGEYLDVCGTKLTAGEVSQTGNRVANALIDLGVRPGDRVATLIENSAEAVVAWWGTILAGAISVPVNTAYKGEYLRHQLHDAGAKVLIVESSLADRAAHVADKLDQLSHVLLIGESSTKISKNVVSWNDALGSDDISARHYFHALRPGDLCLYRRHNWSIQGLHAQPQLPCRPYRSDWGVLGTNRR